MRKYVLYLMLFAGLVTSCNTEQIYQEEGSLAGNTLKLDVTRAGFMEYSETGSRISNSGLSTSFTEGDVIGVLVTQEGKNYNVPYKLNSAGTWEFDNTSGKEIFLKTVAGQLTYRIYYPYSALADNATNKETLESALSIKGNQSAESDYINSDILYEEVTSADQNISVALKHLRSMFSFKPKVKFQTTVATGQNEYYDIQVPDIKFYDGSAEIQCFKTSEGEYRYILDSDKTITWTYEYNGIVYEGSKALSSVSEGTKYSVIEYHNIGVYNETKAKVGDFYCSNDQNIGYVLPKEYDIASLVHKCIGIVFHVGVGNGDNQSDYAGTDIETNGIKGYVVALKDVDGLKWANDGISVNTEISVKSDIWDGYKNTDIIKQLSTDYPAFDSCINFQTSTGLNTSGWYLPSIAQINSIKDSYEFIKHSFEDVKSSSFDFSKYYWSSTRNENNIDEVAIFWKNTVYYYGKSNICSVRPVLTF
ncbi:hypothetical protein [Bacteroides sp.]|uniref:fimbrillin family protein n=1 Tax=Bacteroides sp. TaxID=29523 RepID=UPI00258C2A27|nr:hypothetical protein [Bacteroides sp.]